MKNQRVDIKTIISEAKDHLSEQSSAIRETRNKCWVLLAGSFAIEAFFLQTIIQKTTGPTNLDWGLLIGATVLVGGLICLMLKAIFPSELYFNGVTPDHIDDNNTTWEQLSLMYQRMIEGNDTVLNDLARAYKHSVIFCALWAVISFALCLFFESHLFGR